MTTALATTSPRQFMLVSQEFGYPIYAAYVPGRNDVQITDLAHEAAMFDFTLNDGDAMAGAISAAYGYTFAPVAV